MSCRCSSSPQRDSRADLRRGFDRGCDDYLTKLFSLEELTLRIAAVLRRSGRTDQVDGPLQTTDLVLDDRAHQVTRAGREVLLPLTEYRILRYLLQGRGQALSKAQIIEAVRAGISLIGQASPDVTRS